MNSSDEFWSIDNVSLHQYGWSVETVSGRHTTPPLRGDDETYAGVPGEVWRPKTPAGYTLGLPMFLIGADPADGTPVADPRLQWNDSWNFLRKLLWQPDREFKLTRRWLLTNPVSGLPEIVTADAQGQLATGSQLLSQMVNRTKSRFTVDVRLAHPFFYGQTWVDSGPITVADPVVEIDNAGDVTACWRHLTCEFVGPLTDPRLINSSTPTPVMVGFNGTIPDGHTITCDVGRWLAYRTAGTNDRIGALVHSGSQVWMALVTGTNQLTLTGSGAGYARVRFRTPYL